MDRLTLIRAIEAILFVSGEPVTLKRLEQAFTQDGVRYADVKAAMGDLARDYVGRGVEVVEISGGYQMRTSPDVAQHIIKMDAPRPTKLTQAAMETLAIIAYRQPVTRAEAEDVRGVDCGAVVRSLVERGLIRVVGKKDVPGRPLLYGTTKKFLEVFGLSSLVDLPTLRQIEEITAMSGEEEPTEEGSGTPPATPPPATEEDPFLPFDEFQDGK